MKYFAFIFALLLALAVLFGASIAINPRLSEVETQVAQLQLRADALETMQGHGIDELNALGASLNIPTPIAFYEDSLQARVSPLATTFNLVRGTDSTGTSLASSTYAFVLSEGTPNEEVVLADCTGKICTNMVRGISPITGTSSVALLIKEHRRGDSAKMTDASFIPQFKRLLNGEDVFPNVLGYASSVTCSVSSSNKAICPKDYIDGVVVGGASNANDTTKGIVEMATFAEAALGTSVGGTGARLALGANISTSTPNGTLANGFILALNSLGKIAQAAIDLTLTYTWTGLHTFAGGINVTGASTFSATTTAATSTLMVDIDTIVTVMASTTFTGFTSPQPAYIATSTGALNLADANSVFDEQFMGFAVSNATNGQQVLLQRQGIVTGFSGLTKGSDYYVSDTVGTISATVGTAEVYVGRAISTTQILMEKSIGMQYLGSQTLTCQGDTVINQPLARFAKITGTAAESGGSNTTSTHYMEIAKVGKTTDSWLDYANVGSAILNQLSVTWTATSSIRSSFGGNSGQCSGTVYYYR